LHVRVVIIILYTGHTLSYQHIVSLLFTCKLLFQNSKWLVWYSGNSIRHINEVVLRRSQLVLRLVADLWRVYQPRIYPDQLILASRPWVGAMSIEDGFGHL